MVVSLPVRILGLQPRVSRLAYELRRRDDTMDRLLLITQSSASGYYCRARAHSDIIIRPGESPTHGSRSIPTQRLVFVCGGVGRLGGISQVGYVVDGVYQSLQW